MRSPNPRPSRRRSLALARACIASNLAWVGCPSDPPDDLPSDPVTLPFALAPAWERLANEDMDVFADQRPDDATCDDIGYSVDPIVESIEILTELCNYLTLHQPSLERIDAGDTVTIHAYHDVLTADEPAEGYLALAIDGDIEWEYRVPIPTDAQVIEEQITIDRDIPASSDVQIHVHNHGPNSWEVIRLLVTHPGG